MFDQAFHPAQTLGQREQLARSRKRLRAGEIPLQDTVTMPPNAAICRFGKRVLRMAFEARIDHAARYRSRASSQRAIFERVARNAAPCAAPGSSAAQGEEAVERPGDGADRVLQEGDPLGDLRVLADHRDAAHHVGMAVRDIWSPNA